MSENEAPQEAKQEEEPKDFSPGHEGTAGTAKKKKNIPWKPVAGFAAVAILFFAIGFMLPRGGATGLAISGTQVKTSQEAGTQAVDYINKYLLQPGFEAKLVSANESNGLYSIELNISSSTGSTIYPSYVTKDGKLLFVSAVDLSQTPETAQTETPATTTTPKTDKPNVKMFVMSYCPYGEQAEVGLGPAVEALGASKIAFEPHFVIYSNYQGGGPNYCFDNASLYCSMHGINEIREDIRQMVIWKYWPDKWWAYVNKVNAETSTGDIETKWKGIATAVGLDSVKIQEYFDKEALALLANEAALNEQYGVSGSPTILINDVQYSGGRSPDAFQSGICAAFNTPPSACGQILNATASDTPAGACG